MIDIALIVLICAIVWYWWDTAYCNELAYNSCRAHCEARNLQLLDNSVVRQRVWLRRNEANSIQICRLYNFAYSDDNESRQVGYILLISHQVVETHIESHQLH